MVVGYLLSDILELSEYPIQKVHRGNPAKDQNMQLLHSSDDYRIFDVGYFGGIGIFDLEVPLRKSCKGPEQVAAAQLGWVSNICVRYS